MNILNKIIFFSLILILQTGIVFSNEFKLTKKHKVQIFEENEMVKSRFETNLHGLVNLRNYSFIKDQNKQVDSIITAIRIDTTGEIAAVKNYLNGYFFNSKESFFTNKPENNVYMNNKKTNLLVIRDFNLNKWLSTSDDFPEIKTPLKKLIFKHGLKTPENILRSDHLYFKGNGSAYWVSYMYNYKKDISENTFKSSLSKFHPNIIKSEKKYNAYMKKWINLSIKRHDIFQTDFKIKRKLDLNSISNVQEDLDAVKKIFYEASLDGNKEKDSKAKLEVEKKEAKEKEEKEKTTSELLMEGFEEEKKIKEEEDDQDNSNNVNDLINRIKELNDLYKNGVISEDEFQILKQKLISK